MAKLLQKVLHRLWKTLLKTRCKPRIFPPFPVGNLVGKNIFPQNSAKNTQITPESRETPMGFRRFFNISRKVFHRKTDIVRHTSCGKDNCFPKQQKEQSPRLLFLHLFVFHRDLTHLHRRQCVPMRLRRNTRTAGRIHRHRHFRQERFHDHRVRDDADVRA